MKKYMKSLISMSVAGLIVSSLSFSNVFAQTLDSKSNVQVKSTVLTKTQNNEMAKAFSKENVQDALKKVDFNKNNVVQTIKLSDNCSLNVKVTSIVNKNSPNKNLYSSNSITKSVYIDANAFVGWKIWSLQVAGTFGYDGYSSWVQDTNISPNTFVAGWSYCDSSVRGVQISSHEAKVIGSAKFYLGLQGTPIQSFTPVIAVGCDQNGGTITYN
ncbi:hypothetical protein HBE96_09225 [Clostridium sp. P21]|uniref:Uncharacterized protein n=1 Tax=Clostridium muellerianum TaxID=2716538 RepID=A0A7Y0HMD9_9CLOT|nr:hypothetical protein [Clostridium muellerianum]NMM62879.1 hypothetical protein [Clostridium muellerianum]